MEDLEYIKKFSKITIKNVCDKVKVDKSNLYAGRVNKNKVKKIRKMIENDIATLYILEEDQDEKTNSTL